MHGYVLWVRVSLFNADISSMRHTPKTLICLCQLVVRSSSAHSCGERNNISIWPNVARRLNRVLNMMIFSCLRTFRERCGCFLMCVKSHHARLEHGQRKYRIKCKKKTNWKTRIHPYGTLDTLDTKFYSWEPSFCTMCSGEKVRETNQTPTIYRCLKYVTKAKAMRCKKKKRQDEKR
jgi:hypothetical protein